MSADIYIESDGCCCSHDHNVTHNLAPMFRAAGVDWHDYSVGFGEEPLRASFLAAEATAALANLVDEPERFKRMNPENGWGSYEVAVVFLSRLILDCHRHPDAIVRVSL